ncbi:MAG: acylphosphatase [Acidobacteriota bacterium]
MTVVARRWWVRGRVQGVWFRGFTRAEASTLGLVGTVRNLSDGRVEVEVAGDAEKVEALRKRLLVGPEMARVEGLDEDSALSDGESERIRRSTSFEMIR